ncbi:unnamed protein product [Ceutorhynchus assimilis]|uniref:Endonuclease/exonuclease/phosphatase domain-containing protein n=1 Tax=Ceutorhynchus assimilis TaxID=467358 RepID=A0A9N9MP64_9CUCU|nr:unnamed protein product [Ceutorhynchus assimilis]
MLTKTNLSNTISNAELGLDNYIVFRKDPSRKKSMGGTLIAIHKSLPCYVVPTNPKLEQIFVCVGQRRAEYIIECLYIPPNSPNTTYLMVSESIDFIRNKYPSAELYIAGDFNLPRIEWNLIEDCSIALPRTDLYL